MSYNIIGILVRKPLVIGASLQKLLGSYGCIIRNRLGLNHKAIDGGLIILDLHGDKKQIELFLVELSELEGIEHKQINF